MASPDSHTYKYNVSMSCSGCSGAVERVLQKLDGNSPHTHTPLSNTQINPRSPSLHPSFSFPLNPLPPP